MSTPSPSSAPPSSATPKWDARFAAAVYRFRWLAAPLLLAVVFGLFAGGIKNIEKFSAQVGALSDTPPEVPKQQVFDPRSDIWFDADDPALSAYQRLEAQFIAEDYVFISLEEHSDPLGVFGTKSLETVARLTGELEKIPYVRNVRSLTENPWIRWGEVAPGEEGLLVGDLFENPPASYTEEQRLQRMIAVLGAERSAKLVGEERVRAVIGKDANFADYLGEPRLLRSVLSEDGRATAIQIQLLRPRVTDKKLDEVFGAEPSVARDVGPVIHKSTAHSEAVVAMRKIIDAEKDYDLHIGGNPVLERHFQQVGQGDMAYVGLMFAVIALVLLLIYRRAAGVVLPLLVVFTTILGMIGFVFVRGDLLNNLTAVAPTMMTVVGIADAVHLVTAYYVLRPQHGDKQSLITEVLRLNALPVFLTSVTTAVGFFSLTTSSIVPVRELGYTAGSGTILAYLLSMSLVPAFLSLFPVKPVESAGPSKVSHGPHWSDRLIDLVLRRRSTLIAATAVGFVLSFWGASQVAFSTDLRLMFGKGDRVAADLLWQGDHIGGSGDIELVFHSAVDDAVQEDFGVKQTRMLALQARALSPEAPPLNAAEATELKTLEAQNETFERQRIAVNSTFLEQVDRFERQIRKEAEDPTSPMHIIVRVDSALDVLRKMHQVQNENRAAFYRVPTEADVPEAARSPRVTYDDIAEEAVMVPAQTASSMVAQYYVQYENGAKPSENLSSLLTADRRGFRMTLRQDAAPTLVSLAAYDRIREMLRTDFPMLAGSEQQVAAGTAFSTATVTGKQYMFTNMFDRFSDTMVVSLGVALSVITVLIGLVFRSATLALISLIPNVLPIVLPLGIFGLLGFEVDGPSVVVASVALGVCVDDTIHLLTKFTQARSHGYSVEDALRRSFRQVGAALTWTSLTLVLGFAVLVLGVFRPNVMTGYLGATMIALAWLADFLLTPALLSLLAKPETETIASAEPVPAGETAG